MSKTSKWIVCESQYLNGQDNVGCMDMVVMDVSTGHKYLLCKRCADVSLPPTWCVAFDLPEGGDTLGTVHGELRRRNLGEHIINIGAVYDPMPWSAEEVHAIADAATYRIVGMSVDEYNDKCLSTAW